MRTKIIRLDEEQSDYSSESTKNNNGVYLRDVRAKGRKNSMPQFESCFERERLAGVMLGVNKKLDIETGRAKKGKSRGSLIHKVCPGSIFLNHLKESAE